MAHVFLNKLQIKKNLMIRYFFEKERSQDKIIFNKQHTW